ncbi:MAG: hypothetical protein JXA25_19950 [Anaerolineales bacterium]|nr:hypothetical protein [Anaerolineales bacterium]
MDEEIFQEDDWKNNGAAEAAPDQSQDGGVKRKTYFLITAAAIVLAIGAFLAVRYITLGPAAFKQSLVNLDRGTVSMGPEDMPELIPAEELPVYDPEVNGIVGTIEDNRLYLTSIESGLTVVMDSDNGMEVNTVDENAPSFEVVVTNSTEIYRDDTNFFGKTIFSEEMPDTIQQVIVPVDSIDELEINMIVSVWGKKQDDRIIADFLLYEPLPEFDLPG